MGEAIGVIFELTKDASRNFSKSKYPLNKIRTYLLYAAFIIATLFTICNSIESPCPFNITILNRISDCWPVTLKIKPLKLGIIWFETVCLGCIGFLIVLCIYTKLYYRKATKENINYSIMPESLQWCYDSNTEYKRKYFSLKKKNFYENIELWLHMICVYCDIVGSICIFHLLVEAAKCFLIQLNGNISNAYADQISVFAIIAGVIIIASLLWHSPVLNDVLTLDHFKMQKETWTGYVDKENHKLAQFDFVIYNSRIYQILRCPNDKRAQACNIEQGEWILGPAEDAEERLNHGDFFELKTVAKDTLLYKEDDEYIVPSYAEVRYSFIFLIFRAIQLQVLRPAAKTWGKNNTEICNDCEDIKNDFRSLFNDKTEDPAGEIETMLRNAALILVSNDEGLKTYVTPITNTTKYTFSSFRLDAMIYDKDNVFVETAQGIPVVDFKPGDTGVFKLKTKKDISNYELKIVYFIKDQT